MLAAIKEEDQAAAAVTLRIGLNPKAASKEERLTSAFLEHRDATLSHWTAAYDASNVPRSSSHLANDVRDVQRLDVQRNPVGVRRVLDAVNKVSTTSHTSHHFDEREVTLF